MDLNQFFFKYVAYYPVVFFKTKGFFLQLKALQKSQYYSYDEIEKIRLKKIKALIEFSRNNIPFYLNTLRDIKSKDIHSIKDIANIPFITKAHLKNTDNKFTPQQEEWLLTNKTTGGSTGQPVTIQKTRQAMAAELAATWRGYSWAGIDIGKKQARFWGVPFSNFGKFNGWLTDKICNRIRLSAFSFNDDSLMEYTKRLKRFKPDYFYGYVSMLCDYARFCSDRLNNIPIAPHCIITTAEVLSSSQRELLQRVFKTKVYNEYGCGELGTIAHECEYGNMHISAENMIVEILDGNRICEDGEIGEIVVTELNNFAMPLIRYRLGDFGVISKNKCLCGRTLPILEAVKGRAYDTIRSPEGKSFHGEFFMYIFEEAKRKNLGIGKFQVIQMSLTHLHVNIIPEKGYTENAHKLIKARVQSHMGNDVQMTFSTVDSIPREKSGKMRVIISIDVSYGGN